MGRARCGSWQKLRADAKITIHDQAVKAYVREASAGAAAPKPKKVPPMKAPGMGEAKPKAAPAGTASEAKAPAR